MAATLNIICSSPPCCTIRKAVLWLRGWFFLELPFELAHTPRDIKFDEYPSVRDQKDSPILATAILEDIDVFITRDKDFLVLEIETPDIITMNGFMEKYVYN